MYFTEFSEALHEMGTCLVEKTALNEDEENGECIFGISFLSPIKYYTDQYM